jgi:predicted RNase H-like HicB family nuclease
MTNSFTAVYKKMGRWYVAYVEELPGANTQGRTLREARVNLRQAVRLILEANRRLAEEQLGGEEALREQITVKA